MKIWTKWLQVPSSNATKKIEAVQLWEVRWHGRRDEYDYHGHPEMEAFPTREAAEHFRDALVNAFKLIRHNDEHAITLSHVWLDGGGLRIAS